MVDLYSNKFKIVDSFEELSKQTGYYVLYITNDPDKAMIFYLMSVYEYRSYGGSYYDYRNCSYLGDSIIVWLYKDELPGGFKEGLYYKNYCSSSKYRTSFPFPYTPSKYTDEEVKLLLSKAKDRMHGYNVTINDRKSLKAKWNDVVFQMTWLKGWIDSLSIIEQNNIKKERADAEINFQTFLSKVFDDIPELTRTLDYWDKTKFKNEWKAEFKFGHIIFRPYGRIREDGTYAIEAASPMFGSHDILTNHRKTIIKLLQITKKYQDDFVNLFEK